LKVSLCQFVRQLPHGFRSDRKRDWLHGSIEMLGKCWIFLHWIHFSIKPELSSVDRIGTAKKKIESDVTTDGMEIFEDFWSQRRENFIQRGFSKERGRSYLSRPFESGNDGASFGCERWLTGVIVVLVILTLWLGSVLQRRSHWNWCGPRELVRSDFLRRETFNNERRNRKLLRIFFWLFQSQRTFADLRK
jgi:hypothetical protein